MATVYKLSDLGVDHATTKELYNQYSQAATQAGVTPTDINTFYKDNSSKNALDSEGLLAGYYETNLYPQVAKQYNDSITAYYKAQGTNVDPGQLMSTTYNTKTQGDWRGQGSDYMLNQVKQVSGKATNYSNSAKTADENKAPDLYSNPDVAKVKDELTALVDKGVPDFAYKGTSEADYISQWNKQLSTLNQPQTDYALGKLNKSVAEGYNMYNPYTLGSGTQLKATQDATNQYMMNSIANQDAQAMALGQANYNQDYGTAYNQWQNTQNQYNAAQSKLLDLGTAETAGKSADYYNTLNRQWGLSDTKSQQDYTAQQQALQQQWAQSMAQMYQPQKQDWYQPILNAALTGVGYGVGGAAGGAIGGGIANLFGTSGGSQITPYSSQYMNLGNSSYNNQPAGGYQQGSVNQWYNQNYPSTMNNYK